MIGGNWKFMKVNCTTQVAWKYCVKPGWRQGDHVHFWLTVSTVSSGACYQRATISHNASLHGKSLFGLSLQATSKDLISFLSASTSQKGKQKGILPTESQDPPEPYILRLEQRWKCSLWWCTFGMWLSAKPGGGAGVFFSPHSGSFLSSPRSSQAFLVATGVVTYLRPPCAL